MNPDAGELLKLADEIEQQKVGIVRYLPGGYLPLDFADVVAALRQAASQGNADDRYWELRNKVEELVFDPIRRGGRTEAEILGELGQMRKIVDEVCSPASQGSAGGEAATTVSENIGVTVGCICQNQHRRGHCTEPGCPFSIRPVDAGALHAAAQTVGDGLKEKVIRLLDLHHGSTIPTSQVADAILTLTFAQASLWSCTGCGSQVSLEQIKSEGFLSCCPERKMAPPVPSAHRGGALRTVRRDDVDCQDISGGCGWPECDCPKKLKGGFACPICGKDTPHHHAPERPTCSGCMVETCEDCFDQDEIAKIKASSVPSTDRKTP